MRRISFWFQKTQKRAGISSSSQKGNPSSQFFQLLGPHPVHGISYIVESLIVDVGSPIRRNLLLEYLLQLFITCFQHFGQGGAIETQARKIDLGKTFS